MAQIKLTAGRIRDFECPTHTKQAFLWDSVVPGLGVRATASAKVFIFQSRLAGKSIRIRIGDVRTWSIDSADPPGARQEGRRLQGLIDKGIDPRLDKQRTVADTARQQAEAQREKATVAQAWAAYIEDRAPKWSERHLADHQRAASPGGEKKRRGKGKTKPGALAPLMGLRLAEVTPEQVKAWASSEAAKRGTQTRIAFDALRAFINWCATHPDYAGMASTDACSTRTKRDTLPKRGVKDDCLQREQLNAWFGAVRGLSNPAMAAYLQALLLTGARRNELAGLRWDDLDFRWNSMTIHDKVDGERTIPLTPYLKTLLTPLPRRNAWVFSSPKAASGRLEEPRIPHNRAIAAAGIEGLTLHGLRRSFGTLSEWVEVPAGVVAQIMGHKPSATAEKHYRRRPLDLLRMWHTKVEAWILEQAGIEQPGEVATVLQVVKQA
ncbi:tyrosine-type recombinase/integrase [Desulfatitalea alkaliphila]|uniref:Site-specific integrase n=1 Tax=Desulfatitalea alkaliphila TaxID=2929485 RepID=A0AA41UM11_9BACT|nr:site-specific integrase [Desulfatitalea alkaliphila]MCJ8502962.1 site-specific integrase [Desulfatitalea alkaliphila]